MANYNKSVNFAVKDTLESGDPNKVVSGAEIDNEFNNISASSASKADKAPSPTEDNVAALTSLGGVKDTGRPDSALIPSGGIIMWSGSIPSIPVGWALCDGTNGTPDLRNRFVTGAGDKYEPGNNGGLNEVTLTESQMPSHQHSMSEEGNHTHTGTTSTDGKHFHYVEAPQHPEIVYNRSFNKGNFQQARSRRDLINEDKLLPGTEDAGEHSHTLNIDETGAHTHTINATGGGEAHENRPPYYALAYIMKL